MPLRQLLERDWNKRFISSFPCGKSPLPHLSSFLLYVTLHSSSSLWRMQFLSLSLSFSLSLSLFPTNALPLSHKCSPSFLFFLFLFLFFPSSSLLLLSLSLCTGHRHLLYFFTPIQVSRNSIIIFYFFLVNFYF